MRVLSLGVALLAAVFTDSAVGVVTEIKDAAAVKSRFGKKELKEPVILGYIPKWADCLAFTEAARKFTNLPFYYVHDRATLDTLGMVSGDTPVVAIHRPWAGGKKFKTTFRGSLGTKEAPEKRFLDFVANEALPLPSFVGEGFKKAYEESAEHQKKAVLKLFVATETLDMSVNKPDDWDQPEKIGDPKSEKPSDWDDEEDGEWSPEQIPNPDYKGEWVRPLKDLMVLDPEHTKPVDWDQPEKVPNPASVQPADWDEDEDGPFQADEIDNPEFKGEWKQRSIANPEFIKKAQDILKPIQEKFGKKLITMVCGMSDQKPNLNQKHSYDFSAETINGFKAVALEQPKFSAMTQKNIWLMHSWDAEGSLEDWVDQWQKGKLVDVDKARRQKMKEDRLSKK